MNLEEEAKAMGLPVELWSCYHKQRFKYYFELIKDMRAKYYFYKKDEIIKQNTKNNKINMKEEKS